MQHRNTATPQHRNTATPQHVRHFLLFILLGVLFNLFNSCTKDLSTNSVTVLKEQNQPIEGDYPIEVTKQYYERQQNLRYIHSIKGDEYNPANFEPKPQWNEAKFYKVEEQIHLTIPIKYNSGLPLFGVSDDAESNFKKYGNRLKGSVNLVVTQKDGLIYMVYQVFYGDERFLSIDGNTAERANCANLPKGFSGFESIFDLNGKPLKAWQYKNGKVYNLERSKRLNNGQLNVRCAALICNWTSYSGGYSIDDGVFTRLGGNYRECYFVYDCEGEIMGDGSNGSMYGANAGSPGGKTANSTNTNTGGNSSTMPPISSICVSALRDIFQNKTPVIWNNTGGGHIMPISNNITSYSVDFKELQLDISSTLSINMPTYSIDIYGAPNSGLTPNAAATAIAVAFDITRNQYSTNLPPRNSWTLDYSHQFLEDWTNNFNDNKDNKINPNNSNSKNKFGVSITTSAYPVSATNVLVNKSGTCN
jgi:hypothetical protein